MRILYALPNSTGVDFSIQVSWCHHQRYSNANPGLFLNHTITPNRPEKVAESVIPHPRKTAFGRVVYCSLFQRDGFDLLDALADEVDGSKSKTESS